MMASSVATGGVGTISFVSSLEMGLRRVRDLRPTGIKLNYTVLGRPSDLVPVADFTCMTVAEARDRKRPWPELVYKMRL